jgi:uncharacterized protein (TIGR03435 family)
MMTRATVTAISLAIGCAVVVMAQSPQPSLSFEVASVRPAAPPPSTPVMTWVHGGPGTADPGQITYRRTSLKQLLKYAYAVQDYQLDGPAWLDSTRFDVKAKVPLGATKEQARIMLQNLLVERFSLKLHHEQRDLPAYALVVAKGGSKMKTSGAPTKSTPEGFPRLPPGQERALVAGLGPAGQLRLNIRKETCGQLAVMLTGYFNQPVIDATGLDGAYDFTLEYMPGHMRRADGTPSSAQAEEGVPVAPTPEREAPPTIFSALQSQLGLRLDSRKAPFDVLVIDRIEKIPTEN